jgi:hypothetical protein
MVKDEFSDSDHGPPSATDGLGRDPDDKLAQSPLGNLTQELARLLAASIAHNQTNNGPSGIPTNAELINLANLVSAAAAQHTLAPAFKDGLSSLSYGQPRSLPRHQQSAASSALEPDDDEQMPIPATWRQPSLYEDDHWFRQQMGAAVLGLIAGLMIVVPAVLWLSGFFGPQRSGSASLPAIQGSPSADANVADVKTVTVQVRPVDQQPIVKNPSESASQFVIGNLESQRAQPLEAKSTLPPFIPVIPAARLVDPNKARIQELLAQASQRIESGDVIGAREMLAGAEDGTQGTISFVLAETYDPNMLAAGIRAIVADADRHATSTIGPLGSAWPRQKTVSTRFDPKTPIHQRP